MNEELFKKFLTEKSDLKDKYTIQKWFSEISKTYSDIKQKPFFDSWKFFEDEHIEKEKEFLDISKEISNEINEKNKSDQYTKSLIITYLDKKQSFDFDADIFREVLAAIAKIDEQQDIVHCYTPIYGLESNFQYFEVNEEYLTVIKSEDLPVDKIVSDDIQVRSYNVDTQLEQLAENMKPGLINPILVYEREDGNYELVVGQRRLLAATKILNWKTIRATIIEKPVNNLTAKIIIKQITPSEFDTITQLKFLNSEYAVDKRVKNLQYVAHFTFDKNNDDSEKKINLLQDSLRLTKSGLIQIGPEYYRYTPGLKAMPITPKIGYAQPPEPSRLLELDDDNIKKFYDHIFKNLKNLRKNFDENDIRYINSAIRRFGYIYKNSEKGDKILDLMITLETLLSTDPMELGLKIANRTLVLLGDIAESKKSIQEFVKKCYSKRSELVHGKKRKPFVISGKELEDEQVAEELEDLVRRAINKIITLHHKMEKQNKILDYLDENLIN